MTKFNFPKRVDFKRADNGVELPINDIFGDYWGKYTVRWMNGESARGRKVLNDLDQRNDALKTTVTDDLKRGLIGFVEFYLVGWDIPEEITGGKPLPFTVENAIEFLSHDETSWLAERLLAEARDIRNFRFVVDAKGNVPSHPEKNSSSSPDGEQA